MRRYVFEKRWKRGVAATIDAVGVIFSHLRARPVPALRRVLVLRLDHLGDVILALPVVEALARLTPRPHVTMLTSPAGAVLLRDMPGVDERLAFAAPWFTRGAAADSPARLVRLLRSRHFDAALELRGDARHILLLAAAGIPFRVGPGSTGGGFLLHREVDVATAAHASEQNLFVAAAAGAPAGPASRDSAAHLPRLTWRPRPEESAWLAELGLPARVLLFHPGAGAPAKKWPETRFAALAAAAARRGWEAAVIGTDTASEATWPESARDLRGKTSLPQLVTLIQACGALVSNDSGPAHIATALQKPVLLPWSWANDPALWAPRTASVVDSRTPCAPCRRLVCTVAGHPCLTEITVERMQPRLDLLLDALET